MTSATYTQRLNDASASPWPHPHNHMHRFATPFHTTTSHNYMPQLQYPPPIMKSQYTQTSFVTCNYREQPKRVQIYKCLNPIQ